MEEFKSYLKERITPTTEKSEPAKHSYDFPKLNYDDFSPNDFNPFGQEDDDFDFETMSRRKKSLNSNIEDLPNHIKILMMTNFFDDKF